MSGKLILLEGGEGVGKTTQGALLIDRLSALGLPVRLVREPGGDAVAEEIRTFILSDHQAEMEPLTELFLFCAARAQVVATKVKPVLDQGCWVVSDRGALSSVVYQGHVKGIELAAVQALNEIALGKIRPDLCLVLNAPADLALKRRQDEGGANRFEAEGLSFHRQINEHYLVEAKRQRLPIVDASKSVEEVHEQIWAHIKPLLSLG